MPAPPGAQSPSAGFQSFNDQTTRGYGELTIVVSMDVPAGSYLVTAKLWVENPAGEQS